MRRARLAVPAVLVAVATGLCGCSTETAPAAGDTMLATAFPLTSVLVAALEAAGFQKSRRLVQMRLDLAQAL